MQRHAPCSSHHWQRHALPRMLMCCHCPQIPAGFAALMIVEAVKGSPLF